MENQIIDRETLDFLLFDWLKLEDLMTRPRYNNHSLETVLPVLDLAEKIALNDFLPALKASDQKEPWLDGENVHVIPEIRDAVQAYIDTGLMAAPFDESLYGMQFPQLVSSAALGIAMAASISASAFPMLTMANARLIASFGSEAQKQAFAVPQIEGKALGTMCLSEHQAGSSLGDIKTVALDDGTDELGPRYRLRGNKMWISGGDQDITKNIVHLVLAKTTDKNQHPLPGIKGISLFIVPKFLSNGERNDITVAGLNHKMGYRGIPNCLLNFGEGAFTPSNQPGAIGYRIGAVGQGLTQMFQMMNEARLGVGMGAAMIGYRSHQLSCQYASERIQGKTRDQNGHNRPAAIIEHADVKRMLLAQKSWCEGGLALVLYCTRLLDDEISGTDEEQARASALLGILTPIAKSWPSEFGLAANDLAIQIHGGYGYTRDFDVEQLYRDNRLNPIHEGTTGIQGLDLLGRKIIKDGGHVLSLLKKEIDCTIRSAHEHDHLADYCNDLETAWVEIMEVTAGMISTDNPSLDHATTFLRAFGHSVIGWIWLELLLGLQQAATSDDFAKGKYAAARYFFEEELPQARVWLKIASQQSDLFSTTAPEVLLGRNM